MKTRGDKWTENEISLAKDLYIKGISLSEISKQVNHSESAITKKMIAVTKKRIATTSATSEISLFFFIVCSFLFN